MIPAVRVVSNLAPTRWLFWVTTLPSSLSVDSGLKFLPDSPCSELSNLYSVTADYFQVLCIINVLPCHNLDRVDESFSM